MASSVCMGTVPFLPPLLLSSRTVRVRRTHLPFPLSWYVEVRGSPACCRRHGSPPVRLASICSHGGARVAYLLVLLNELVHRCAGHHLGDKVEIEVVQPLESNAALPHVERASGGPPPPPELDLLD